MPGPAAFLVLAGVLAAPAAAENWPGWRGPDRMGHSAEKDLPLTWGPKEHVKWKAPLPDTGNASPVVWGDRVFVTQATEKGTRRGVICFDRASGKQLWFKTIEYRETEPTHATNPHGSATPVTDGERVYASLGSAGLVCYDFSGNRVWQKSFGPQIHIWGNASSPVLYGDLVVLFVGPGETQALVALDKKTGDPVWRHDEPGGKSGTTGNQDWIGSWSTPVVAKVNGRDELILNVPLRVKGFDPKTGKELWACDGLGKLVYTSPVVSDDGIVVAMSGYGGPALAVKVGGSGDVTKTHRLWHHTKNIPQRIGSPVIVGDHAFLVSEPGLGQCFELKAGRDLWEKTRLTSTTWGSLVSAGGRLYVTNVAGETLVLAPTPEKADVLATNKLPDKVLASIAVADGELFIRGYKNLWCIGK
jgi:outer membrane protein assembly factor BamB